ncbi:uncharacterized protein METZ01_LOCUS167588, partial [marine metagenome]
YTGSKQLKYGRDISVLIQQIYTNT